MALPKLTKTKHVGLSYFKDKIKGKVYVGIFRINGVLYRKILGYENDDIKTNESIALIKKEQLKNNIKNGSFIKQQKMIFDKLYNEYIENIKNSRSCSLKTIKNKESTYNAHFKNIFRNKDIETISNLEIQKFANELLKNKAPKTVQNIISDLAAIFEFGKKHKFVKVNPANDIELPKYDNTRVFPLTEEESKRLFNTIINYDEILYRGIFTFLLHGRRKDEILSLTWDMIDLENRTYTIPYEINKVKKNMTYDLTDLQYDILINIENKNDIVFKSPLTNKKIQNIRHAWNRILATANINKKMRIHDLRHLIGEVSLNNVNSSLEIVAAILGQTTTSATKRYAKVQRKVASQGLKKVFDYLKE